jgi:transcriptional regulator with XRE-family HTH domain
MKTPSFAKPVKWVTRSFRMLVDPLVPSMRVSTLSVCLCNSSGRPSNPPLQSPMRCHTRRRVDPGFGPRLAALRKERGLTRVQLAETTKTTQRSISYYETGNGVPPASIVVVLAQPLRVSADEVVGLKPPPMAALGDDDPETRRLWSRFHLVTQFPEKDRRAVIRLIHSLAALVTPRKNGIQGARHGR